MRRSILLSVSALALLAAPLSAQKKPAPKPVSRPPVQQVIPPKAVYWLSANTQTGFGINMAGGKGPSTGDMMRMAMGGGSGGPTRGLTLDLGSKLPLAGPPTAQHAIPPAMNMGPSLALKTPDKAPPYRESGEPPEDFERPKGRILLFWGCGEEARPGQPVIIDFASMAAGQVPPGLFAGERIRIARPPSSSSWPRYGGWPNDDQPSRRGIPAGASLIGAHQVTGNYTPTIDFTLSQDWMPGLDMRQQKLASGAVGLSWNMIPTSTGHFAQLMGASDDGGGDNPTIVFWSSSETQTFISALGDYIAPAEAARLVSTKQLMPPAQTTCAIPRQAVAAVQGGMLTLVAHGPEQNVVHPPRPADPRTPWAQEYAVKARFVSRAGGILGMEEMATNTRRPSNTNCRPRGDSPAGGMAGAVLGGLLGRRSRNQLPECPD